MGETMGIRAMAPLLLGALLCTAGVGALFALASVGSVREASFHDATAGDAALRVYGVPFLPRGSDLLATYEFPRGPGDAFVVDCEGLDALSRGEDPASTRVARLGERSGEIAMRGTSDATTDPPPPPTGLQGCQGLAFVLRWRAAEPENAPTAAVRFGFHPLDFAAGRIAMALAGAGVVLLVAGLVFRRAPERSGPAAAAGRTELLLEVADRMADWLRRTRRYLLLAGVFGILVWFPVGVPVAYALGSRAALSPWGGLLLATLVGAALLAITAWWVRALRELTSDLAAYEERLARLHAEQEEILR